MDCIGAAAGVCAIARKRGSPAYIIREAGQTLQPILEKLAQLPEYQGRLSLPRTPSWRRTTAPCWWWWTPTGRSRWSQELLESCNKVAVIDHHRRAATYIERGALNYHEPYASSASELVTELLQYIAEPTDLLRTEAEALLAGIVLDTKNFTMRTGGRTFEAAAFPRRSGADTGR